MKLVRISIGALLLSLFSTWVAMAQTKPFPQKLKKMNIEQPAIIYAYDALCGWCYGFSPVITNYAAQHSKYKVYALSGGMITGSRIGPIGEVAPYIKWAYKEVENAAGVKFGKGFLEGILEPGTAVFSSLKPSYALSAFKQMKGEDKGLAFAADLQKAIYFDGIRPDEWDSFKPLAEKYGLNWEAFKKLMMSPEIKAAAENDFALCSEMGVQGFPTIFIAMNNKLYEVARGFVPADEFANRVANIEKMAAK